MSDERTSLYLHGFINLLLVDSVASSSLLAVNILHNELATQYIFLFNLLEEYVFLPFGLVLALLVNESLIEIKSFSLVQHQHATRRLLFYLC